MRSVFAVILLATALLSSCASKPKWQPGEPLVTLHDIHGLFGGHELLIDQTGQVWDRKVDNSQRETRHFFKLSEDEFADLNRSIRTSGILRYREKPFSPGPCVTRITITVSLPGRPAVKAEMWDHFDRAWEEPNFTRFRLYLGRLCERAEKEPGYSSGQHNRNRPLP